MFDNTTLHNHNKESIKYLNIVFLLLIRCNRNEVCIAYDGRDGIDAVCSGTAYQIQIHTCMTA